VQCHSILFDGLVGDLQSASQPSLLTMTLEIGIQGIHLSEFAISRKLEPMTSFHGKPVYDGYFPSEAFLPTSSSGGDAAVIQVIGESDFDLFRTQGLTRDNMFGAAATAMRRATVTACTIFQHRLTFPLVA
jgi:hypothetical protein